MRNRRIVQFFVFLFLFLAIYHLSFTWVNFKIQKEADKFALDDNGVFSFEKKQKYLDSIADKKYKVFWLWNFSPEQIRNKSLNFGLDLQGGMSIVVDIDIDRLLINLARAKYRDLVSEVLESIPVDNRGNVSVFLNEIERKIKDKKNVDNVLVEVFESRKYGIEIGKSTNDDVKKFLDDKINNSVVKTEQVIRSRLDKYGGVQPKIQRLKGNRKIQIEVPGVSNKNDIKKLLQGVGEMKFYLEYESEKTRNLVDCINKVLGKEKVVWKDGKDLRLVGEMAYPEDKIGEVEDVLKRPEIFELLPDDIVICKESAEFTKRKKGDVVKLYLLKTDSNGDEILNGDVIVDAQPSLDGKGMPAVVVKMNALGKKLWGDITGNNIGKNIVVTLDGEVIMSANVMYKIPDGVTQISGNYTNDEARNLSMVLRTGVLPAPIRIVEEVEVGPSLSGAAQKQGVKAVLIGLVIIVLFMVVFYSSSGLVANIALILNLLFIVGVLAQLGAVLTLPSIAGLILTLGMAIDANVLINERIKEELSDGKKSVREAVKIGYERASSSIIDANITTLITGVVLYWICSGAVRGFAVTMIIGIVFSFFTSVFVTRYIFYIKRERKSLPNMRFSWPFSKNLLKNTNFNFVKYRFLFYTLSLLIFIVGLFGLYKKGGLRYGVDFTGGHSFVVKMNEEIEPSDIERKLSEVLSENVEVKEYGAKNVVKISTNMKSDNVVNNFDSAMKSMYGENGFKLVSSEVIEASMASDIKKDSVKAIIIVLGLIFLYIMFRFNKWQYGFAAVFALFHDVMLVFAIYGIGLMFGYSVEVNQIFVASILTVVGYSINGTVIIFDKIRELKKNKIVCSDIASCVNMAINGTLSRTFMTSISTIMVVIVLSFYGGESLSSFSNPLLYGIIVGTYSSIFISAPLVKDLCKSI